MTEVMSRGPIRAAVHHGRVNRCGHCRSGHCKSCRGAIRVPKTRSAPSGLVVCYCPNCEPQLRCLECGNQFADDVNPKKWSCLDSHACRGRVQLRQQQSVLWRMIQEAKSAGARMRREDRERREAVRQGVGEEPEDRVAVRRTRPTSGNCECCGLPTKGGNFAPGHDARHKSRLKNRVKQHDDKEAYRELVERGWA